MTPFYFIEEIPHRGPKTKWVAHSREQFIDQVFASEDIDFATYTRADLESCCGEGEAFPDEVYEICDNHGSVTYVSDLAHRNNDFKSLRGELNDGNFGWFAPNEEPDKFEVAKTSLGRDLSRLRVEEIDLSLGPVDLNDRTTIATAAQVAEPFWRTYFGFDAAFGEDYDPMNELYGFNYWISTDRGPVGFHELEKALEFGA